MRKEVSLADEENRKVSDEINITAETTANGRFSVPYFSCLYSFKFLLDSQYANC